MSASIKTGSNTTGVANVDSAYNLNVTTPLDKANAGFVRLAGEVDPGNVVSGGIVREVDISSDYRTRAGLDTLQFQDGFNYTTVNTSVWGITTSIMTVTFPGGYMRLNGGSSTTTAHVARCQTFRYFPLYSTYPLYFEADVKISSYQANNVCEMGLFLAATTAAPTDGVGFRFNAAGNLVGFQNLNGVEVETSAITKPDVGVIAHYLIVINEQSVEFWIDGVLQAILNEPTSGGGFGVVNALALPATFRNYNSGTPGIAVQMDVANINISLGDLNTPRFWNTTMAGMGLGSYQAPPGQTAGQTANYANSAAPTSATLSNTAAGYTTLGGQFQFAAVAGAETDYALFAYQVPAGTATISGRNLVIRNIDIHTYNTGAAVATTATVLQWGLGIGSTAVSLATAESATAAGKAPRRVMLGVQGFLVGDAIGKVTNSISSNFAAAIIAEPGTFVHVILKMPIGTATASQVIRGTVTINGHFE